MRIFNVLEDAVDGPDGAPPGFRSGRTMLAPRLGGSRVGVSVYELPPGEGTFPYHYELSREEWLLVVAGEPTLREPAGERRLQPGDVVCFPVGPEGAHALRNETDGTVRLLLLGDWVDFGYASVQPDTDKLLVRGEDARWIVRGSPQLGYWDGVA